MTYTGAGISTSAGIPDFRGPQGVWTLKAKGEERTEPTVDRHKVQPTLTHMALVSLYRNDYLKYLVSQNCDGLHLKSGIPPGKICELHGNGNVESCNVCGQVYWRKNNVRTKKGRNRSRTTGRKCECGKKLRYTVVAFSQSMPDLCLEKAEVESKKCDVSLCMGTSMRVSPACDLPLMGRKKWKDQHKLVIVNLQKTPYDDKCALRIFAKVDEVMQLLLNELNLEIPSFEPLDHLGEEWQLDFKTNWKFRSPGNDWFEESEEEEKNSE